MKFEQRAAAAEHREAYEEECSWDNDLANIDKAQAIAEDELVALGWPEDQAHSFSLAVNEAVANAIVHGNLGVNKSDGESDFFERIKAAQGKEENRQKNIKLFFHLTKDEATVRIKDEGDFVPGEIVDPTTEKQLLQGNARGLPLIAMKVDNLTFSPGEVVLHKQREADEDVIVI
jgi:anti-sigma regulatory factor (Ser/Thr protein kinase)